ncbi:nitrous oxide reductase family maturation protein NosD [Kingella kingae]|uniref:nitrous oxide reductase family maturation protein NosD n=1 Tax=Kingella kingae TaxID=504 RepID=UPI0002F30E72|nr:nitrous oxide reductase family maturation protein NosD [Kingella kingae]MDK4554791.1 nitrous oxide reductase family maturation protein NosD [Kingella kingae]MDK4564328.1 nitrous oxide reductase family maturation protein NosD [Kingella kingae]MDK4575829.1 nitrous oxide reductase family maturation protein NosD [Kingella kingae]MDK4578426.1 nitrous oxide reductase family maturation protein NosD [Kingella kingae]MDK4583220.1 nitrous oxide reductase family maturation protein NosD [Kingella kinga
MYSKFLFLAILLNVQAAFAADIHVPAGADLQAAIDQAQAGDTLKLAAGTYGKIIINKPLTIESEQPHQAEIRGDRTGRTVWVQSPDVVVRNLTITQSGLSLPKMDAGVFLDKTSTNALIENNHILDNSVGVYLWGSEKSMVRGNKIVGNTQLRQNERGNGVTVWNAPHSQVVGNHISEGRDGIFSNISKFNVFKNNYFTKLRYAVHYMYTNDSEVSGNISDNNEIGYAIMFSERLKVNDNIAVNSINQGIMLNATIHSEITGNAIDTADKCVFVYNANNNKLANNYFTHCTMGIHFTAAPENLEIYGNAFVNNQTQIKYVGTRFFDWVKDGRGNYWSDNSAFDLDGDGIADTAYRPNSITDQILWRAPAARLLMNSPAISIVKWAQQQFPALGTGGITDTKPLINIPETDALKRLREFQSQKAA